MTGRRAIALLLVGLGLAAPAAQAAPPPTTRTSTYISSEDGTKLATEVFRPAGLPDARRTPVIVIVSPYFGITGYDPNGYGTLFYYESLHDAAIPRGYTIVQVTLRGYGGSQGCSDLMGPGEQADSRAAVRWAARQPWSDGRVGMYGLSYDGVTQIMALGDHSLPLKAAVIIAPASSAYGSLYMHGNRYAPFADALEAHNAEFWVPPPSVLSGIEGQQALLDRLVSDPACLAARVGPVRNPDRRTAFWRARELAPAARGSKVPVFYVQGFLDANAKPDQFMPVWQYLRGPKRAWLGQFPHVIPNEPDPFTALPETVGRPGFIAEVMRWYDRYLKRVPRPGAHNSYAKVQEGSTGGWRAEDGWPPSDAADHDLRLLDGAYVDFMGNKGEPFCFRIEGNCPPGPVGQGTWTFSRPLPYSVWLSGVPRVRVHLEAPAGTVNLVAFVYDISPGGIASLITRGAKIARPPQTVSFDLYPQDWLLRPGHRMAVLLSGADDGWFTPGTSGATVATSRGVLTAPFLRYKRDRVLPGGPSTAMTERSTFGVDANQMPLRTIDQDLPPRLTDRG